MLFDGTSRATPIHVLQKPSDVTLSNQTSYADRPPRLNFGEDPKIQAPE